MVGKKVLTVKELRAELEKRGLDVTGKKSALEQRLNEALEQGGSEPDIMEVVDEGSSSNNIKVIEMETPEDEIMEVEPEDRLSFSENETAQSSREEGIRIVNVTELSEDNGELEIDEAGLEDESEIVSASESSPSPTKIVISRVRSLSKPKADIDEEGTEMKSLLEDSSDSSASPTKLIIDRVRSLSKSRADVDEKETEMKSLLEDNCDDAAINAEAASEPDIETILPDGSMQKIDDFVSPDTSIEDVSKDTSQTADDDNDALHLTIGEEDDKFMKDREETSLEETDSFKPDEETVVDTITSVSMENHAEANKEEDSLSNKAKDSVSKLDKVATAISGEGTGKENPINHVSSSSKEDRVVGKNEGNQKKSSDEDRNFTLHVTGLSSKAAANDLKNMFKKHGKIGGVKIMTNPKDPDGSRFALVVVGSSEEMSACIAEFDKCELQGRIIHVEKAGDDMLTAYWPRKEASREAVTGTSNNTEKKSESKKKDGKVKSPPKPVTEQPAEKSKSDKKSTEKAAAVKTGQEPPKSDTRRKSTSSTNAEKPAAKEAKPKPPNRRAAAFNNRRNMVRPVLRDGKEVERKIRREEFARYHPGRVERNPRDPRDHRHHQEELVRHRQAVHVETRGRGREVQRRFQRPGSGFHGRDRSPFRRPSAESPRRAGRQPELTFEDIYDIREKEKRREMERERREIERRRQEDEERQRLLDQEIRMLARQREKIEQEKEALKRQKERMIMVEREKQRQERERLQREKEDIQRRLEEGRRASKRSHADEPFDLLDRKKSALDERSLHRAYLDNHGRPEKEKPRTEVYRHPEPNRYKPLDNLDRRSLTPVRGAPMRNAPVRDSRAPIWDGERERGVRERTPERLTHREREPVKIIRTDDRRDERKTSFPQVIQETARYDWRSLPTDTKSETYTNSSSRDDRWPVRSATAYASDAQLAVLRNESWQAGRETSWGSTERVISRPMSELSERWASGNSLLSSTGRVPIPVAPPPPIFSAPTGGLALNSQFPGASSRYSYDSSYKPLQSQTRR